MKKIKKILRSPFFYVVIVTAVLRVMLGSEVGIYYSSDQGYDDRLLAVYSMLKYHYTTPDVFSLVKTMGFPIFINFVRMVHVKYSIVLSLVWVIDAIYVAYIIYKLSSKKLLSLFSYLYVLFLPMAFEDWLGTRMYRNSIIGPFVLLFFCLLLSKIYSLKENINVKKDTIMSIVLGLIFSFVFYIKEDGIWLLVCLLFFMLIEMVWLTYKKRKGVFEKKKYIKLLISLFIPLTIFTIVTNGYKAINYHFFGVYEIETKSHGELGGFVNRIYKIDSKKRSGTVWAPKDAIEKAFENSKTLQSMPELKEHIFHTDWYNGDIEKNPISGDFLTWVLRTELSNTKIWKSEKQVNNLFKKVNRELDVAFKKGKLTKSNRIQLISSAGGRTLEEILNLNKFVVRSYRNLITLDGYFVGIKDSVSADKFTTKFYADALGEKYIIKNNRDVSKLKKLYTLVENIFSVYKVINPILFAIIFINLIKALICAIKKRGVNYLNLSIIIMFLLISLAYTFSISWFLEFLFIKGINDTVLNFYVIALPVLMIFPYMLSLDMLFNIPKKNK